MEEAFVEAPYRKLEKIGQGSFGSVYKAVMNGSNRVVAIKKVAYTNPTLGIPVETLREIALLRKLSHENIIE
jgi:serine/threonine protein kinase